MKTISVLATWVFILVGCSRDSVENGSDAANKTNSESTKTSYPIKGVWETTPRTNVYIFDNDGSCLVLTADEKEKMIIGEGRWRKTEFSIFEGMMDDVLPGKGKTAFSYYSDVPKEIGDKKLDGHVYEFIGSKPGDGNVKFAYFSGKDSIRIEHGDYSTYLVRGKISRKRDGDTEDSDK